MNCETAQNLMALAVEGDLKGRETIELEHHLEHCVACCELRSDLEESQRELKAWADALVDDRELENLRNAVFEQLDQETEPQRLAPLRRVWHWPIAALLLLACGWVIWSTQQSVEIPTDATVSEATREPQAGIEPIEIVPETSTQKPSILPEVRQLASETLNPAPESISEPNAPVSKPAHRIANRNAEPELPEQAISSTPEPSTTLVKLVTDDPEVLIYWLIET